MKIRFLTFLIVILASVFVFTGCSQAAPAQTEDQQEAQQEEAIPEDFEEAPSDYEGVWLRTGTYYNGALLHTTPATLTLNKISYTSTGTCVNAGDVISDGAGNIRLTVASSSCPNVTSGPGYDATYSMTYNEEGDVEVMTIVTGAAMETYDRQS